MASSRDLLPFLAAFIALALFPFVWALSTSLKTPSQLLIFPPRYIPSPIAPENYLRAAPSILTDTTTHDIDMLRWLAGSEVTEVVHHNLMHSIYFTDPNGIALEASWWVIDATTAPVDFENADLFADPDPVSAVQELASTGRLSSTPRTRLTHEDATVLDPA